MTMVLLFVVMRVVVTVIVDVGVCEVCGKRD